MFSLIVWLLVSYKELCRSSSINFLEMMNVADWCSAVLNSCDWWSIIEVKQRWSNMARVQVTDQYYSSTRIVSVARVTIYWVVIAHCNWVSKVWSKWNLKAAFFSSSSTIHSRMKVSPKTFHCALSCTFSEPLGSDDLSWYHIPSASMVL